MQMLPCVKVEPSPSSWVTGEGRWGLEGGGGRVPAVPLIPALEDLLQINSLRQQVGCSPAATRSVSARNQPANSFRDAGAVGGGGPGMLVGGLPLWYCVIDRSGWLRRIATSRCALSDGKREAVLECEGSGRTARLLSFMAAHTVVCVCFVDGARALMKTSERNLRKPCRAVNLDRSPINSFTSHNVKRETPAEGRQL